jgi:glyoxylase-like metal-dependent hydrolase (beta-lactamase superfamily II)
MATGIREQYKTERVDYVVNSHPDRDHASGLSVVAARLNPQVRGQL